MDIPSFHRIIPWDEVGEEEGTGIVHIAPGCGAEDFELGEIHDLPALAPLTENGIFVDGFGWLTGRDVHDVAHDIFHNLEDKDRLYRVDDYTHRYPVCWRCATPLVFRLVDEWFINMGELYDKPREEVTAEEVDASLRYQIMEVVDQIKWVPEFGYAREMDWLRNMQDWMISKKRYWGLALPIWVCDDAGLRPLRGHRRRGRTARARRRGLGHLRGAHAAPPLRGRGQDRVPQVRQHDDAHRGRGQSVAGRRQRRLLHHAVPHQPRVSGRSGFPRNWISESFPGQFRNWFYSLITMSTVFERKPPTKVVHGYSTLFAEDGRPMHKSWGNAIWFDDAAEKIGVDTMRWLFMNQKLDQNLLFGYARADEARRRFIIPLWNVYAFFVTYAGIDEWTPPADLLDNPSRYEEGQPHLSDPWTDDCRADRAGSLDHRPPARDHRRDDRRLRGLRPGQNRSNRPKPSSTT